jgi:hypothetical protein
VNGSTRLIRVGRHLCASTRTYGKRVSFQRETRRRCARGALRADSLRSEPHPLDRSVMQRPACRDHRCGVYGAKAERPMRRVVGSCGIPITDFRGHTIYAVG